MDSPMGIKLVIVNDRRGERNPESSAGGWAPLSILARSKDSEPVPQLVHPPNHLLGHGDRAPPLALGLAGPFAGGVEADLAAEPRDRRGEIEVIDGRVLDDGGVP